MVGAMGAKSYYEDGYDLPASFDLIEMAVNAVRQGEGPIFVEFETYRWREHCGPNYDNDIGYRTEKEYQAWRSKDPVEVFSRYLQRSEEHTSELQSPDHLVCRLLLEKKKSKACRQDEA